MKIGFIGLGAMGGKMAANLIRKGNTVAVYDLDAAAVDAVVACGGQRAKTAGGAARGVEIVFTSLPNSAIVEETVLGPGGILDSADAGTLLIDLSSITPDSIRRIAAKMEENGMSVLDAPVSGGTGGAEAGTLTIMVGGKEADFQRALPVLQCIGSNITHLGAIGAGDAVKMINNLLLGVNMAAVGEAFALGVKAGIPARTLYDVISASSGASYALTAKYEKFLAKGQFEPGFMINLQYKDLQLAVDTAKHLRTPLLMGNLAQQYYEMARAKGLGSEDISAVVKVMEEYAGILVREASPE